MHFYAACIVLFLFGLPSHVFGWQPILPILECQINYGNDTCVSFWGYNNYNTQTKTIGYGSSNQFAPPPGNRSQPTTFLVGRHYFVYPISHGLYATEKPADNNPVAYKTIVQLDVMEKLLLKKSMMNVVFVVEMDLHAKQRLRIQLGHKPQVLTLLHHKPLFPTVQELILLGHKPRCLIQLRVKLPRP